MENVEEAALSPSKASFVLNHTIIGKVNIGQTFAAIFGCYCPIDTLPLVQLSGTKIKIIFKLFFIFLNLFLTLTQFKNIKKSI